MDRSLSKKGMVLVAPEVQGSSNEAIAEIVEENDIEYTVTSGIRGPSLSRGIPHMMVFDASGKMVFAGHPMDAKAERSIKDALREVDSPEGSSSGLAPRQVDLIALRQWTNNEGKTMEASLTKLSGETGYFKFANGRSFEYPIGNLTEENQALIKEAAAKAAQQ